MEKLIWCKVKQFLEEVRCEDLDRESKVVTCEFEAARQKVSDLSTSYKRCLAGLQKEEQETILDYVTAWKEASFEECQQAYLQGFMDCVLALYGAGVLRPQKELKTIFESFRQS